MRSLIVVFLAAAGGCGPKAAPIDPGHDRPLSVAEHRQEAERHDRVAAREAAAKSQGEGRGTGQPMDCLDQPLAPNPTSGAEELRIIRPCWTSVTARTGDHERRARVHRDAARAHRTRAAELVDAERKACAGLARRDIDYSPFYHREDVDSVEAYREGAQVRGARIVFRKVRGLSVPWLRRAVACHQARAAVMGYAHTFMGYCPLMVGPVQVSVAEHARGIEVVIRTTDEVGAAAVLGRATDLLDGD